MMLKQLQWELCKLRGEGWESFLTDKGEIRLREPNGSGEYTPITAVCKKKTGARYHLGVVLTAAQAIGLGRMRAIRVARATKVRRSRQPMVLGLRKQLLKLLGV